MCEAVIPSLELPLSQRKCSGPADGSDYPGTEHTMTRAILHSSEGSFHKSSVHLCEEKDHECVGGRMI